MPPRLSEEKEKKIIADYLITGNKRETARRNGVTACAVGKVIERNEDCARLLAQKKEQDTADILAYMDANRDRVVQIINLGLDALCDPDKLKSATPAQITTALGTLIDKWTMAGNPLRGGTATIEIKTDNPDVARWLKNDG